MKTSLILIAMTLGETVFAADSPRSLNTNHTGSAAVSEHGRMGTKTRRAARSFSGTPIIPLNQHGKAKLGSPADAATCADCVPENTVEIKSAARFATFQAGTAKTARKTSRKSVSARATAFDPLDPRAQMITPEDGSTLEPTQAFEWSAGDSVDDYFLEVGSCFECNDILGEDEGQNLIRTVSLPLDGRMIYVSLFSSIDGEWYEIDYEYQAASGSEPVAARMISPANGATLGSPQAFFWDGGYMVDAHYLQVGSCEGCNDLYDANEGANLTATVSIPTDARTVFTRLWSYIQGDWYYYDYQYRAPEAVTNAGGNGGGNNVRIDIANPFAYPVNISVNGRVLESVPAFKTAGTNVNVTSLSLSFELIQPTLGSRTLGDPVSGIFQTISNPAGKYLFQISTHIGNSNYFMPLITNHTSEALAIEVNGGLQAENQCGCNAPANADRVGAGYYLLFSNSNVRLFPANADYKGKYVYFGTDANPLYKLITDSSAEVNLVVTRVP